VARPGGSELGQEGRVDNLNLKNAGLVGTLLPSLPLLAALRDLSLQGNNLFGALLSFRGMASLRRRKWRMRKSWRSRAGGVRRWGQSTLLS
jgi:hypothetical protein